MLHANVVRQQDVRQSNLHLEVAMSVHDLTRIIERASSDFTFLTQLNEDPDGALVGYDLTAEERAAVLQPDPVRLEALGVEPRITKSLNGN
jgi:hypothetical protein